MVEKSTVARSVHDWDRFGGKGPWKKRLPQLAETLVSLGRARRVEGGVLSVD